MTSPNAANTANAAPDRQAVVVLGMHRSGTSALAGLLTELGCDGPSNTLGASEHNPIGHFGAESIYLMHERLLSSAGTNWHDFRQFPQDWYKSPKYEDFIGKLKILLEEEYGDSNFFVVKDPRMCRMTRFWRDTFDRASVQPLFVHTHRHPLEVAASLQKRDGFDVEYGTLLWLRHVLDAEAKSRGARRSFTSYERLIGNWPAEAEKIAADFGIHWPRYNSASMSRLDSMVRPDLRRNTAPPAASSKFLARWIRDVQAVLDRWSENGENPQDYNIMDEIRMSFNESAAVFGGSVQRNGLALASARDAAVKEAEEASTRHAELQTELDAVTVARDRISDELALSRNMLDQRKAEIDDTVAELEIARKAAADAERQASELAHDLVRAQQEADAFRQVDIRRNRGFAELQMALLRYQNLISGQTPAAASPQREVTVRMPDELARVTAELDRSNARIDDLLRSNSWKVTGPLRRISEWFKK